MFKKKSTMRDYKRIELIRFFKFAIGKPMCDFNKILDEYDEMYPDYEDAFDKINKMTPDELEDELKKLESEINADSPYWKHFRKNINEDE